jgi:peptidoglycan hydrolase-like protein with peptidoglycan-binding domain
VSAPPLDNATRGRRRRLVVGIGLVVVVALAAGLTALVIHQSSPGGPTAGDGEPTALATVTRQGLASRTELSATLGYAGHFTAINQTAGAAYTWLPAVGTIVTEGQALYDVDAAPVVLLYGSVPAYRTLSLGVRGPDVRQLNADLVRLGDANSSDLPDTDRNDFGPGTVSALQRLQGRLGLPATGALPLGEAVFLPSAARVISRSGSLGGPAAPGGAVLEATSTTRQVTIALDTDLQSEVKPGNPVSITLPDGSTAPGVVSSVGTVATTSGGGGGAGAPTATVQVLVRPSDAAATGRWDQAPVEVAITTASVAHALVVPVDALLALAGGGYAVEVAGPSGRRRLAAVTLGLFDDADGLVQLTDSQLEPGQQVVVPSP